MDPKQRTYPSGSKAYKYTWSAGTVSILLFIVTLYFVIEAWKLRDPFAIYVLAAIWAVTPPIWFWFEYHFVYRKYGETGTMEFFKHGQQVAVAIWAGLAITLAGLASSEHFKPRDNTQATRPSVTQPANNAK